MSSNLNDFFREERKRVFEPGPYFAARVLGQLEARPSAAGMWDLIPTAIRPVMALSLAVLFAVLAVQMLVPVEPPARAALEPYGGVSANERLLLADPQVLTGTAEFEELVVLEPLR